jgi:DNA repair protein RadA/Sms
MGEVGLSGEIRMVSHIDVRLKEAVKLGFENLIIPGAIKKLKNWSKMKKDLGVINIHFVDHVRDLIKFFRS